jgi:hypothetical protein
MAGELAQQSITLRSEVDCFLAHIRGGVRREALTGSGGLSSSMLSQGRLRGYFYSFAGSACAKLQEWPNGSMMRA